MPEKVLYVYSFKRIDRKYVCISRIYFNLCWIENYSFEEMSRRNPKRPRFSVGGQPVFENEDSSNHSGLGVPDYDENSLSQQPETSTNSSDQHHFPQNQFVPDRSKRPQPPTIKPSNENMTNLNLSLDHLFRFLSQKDKEGFFQYPVTDQVGIFVNPLFQ